jgi:hypothetical protein
MAEVTAYCCASRNYLSGAGGGPDGKLEVIAYRPAPTIAELMGDSQSQGRPGA